MKTKKMRKILGVLVVILMGGVLFVYLTFYSPAAKQRRNMLIADDFHDTLSRLVKNHKKFDGIQVGTSTAHGGCHWIVGIVDTQDDLSELEKIVKSSNPPLQVEWTVDVVFKDKANIKNSEQKE